jgi:signal transduction histidine kinase
MATHLYYIAREAVNNAIKHGHPDQIVIRLAAAQAQGALVIQDDGTGIPEVPGKGVGMGLHLMNYRARMIGASLQIQRGETGGTIGTCLFPVEDQEI